MRYNDGMTTDTTQHTVAKVYLSTPALICGVADNSSAFVHALCAGDQSGIQRISSGLAQRDVANVDSSADDSAGADATSAEHKRFYAGHIADERLAPTDDRYDMRLLRILEAALRQLDGTVARAKERYGAARIGVCVGSCDNGSELSLAAHTAYFRSGEFPQNYALTVQGADYPARYAARRFGLTGAVLAFATACSSSASALVTARALILAGICDAVIAGGVDVTSPTVLLGFDGLEAVSADITNPFSANRHGITLGEGAAFFVLSRDDFDDTGMVLAGTGESADASHMTAPLADGTGAQMAMEAALRDAGISACDIDYINLHGTGTRLNDSMESKAVVAVFGTAATASAEITDKTDDDNSRFVGAGANCCPSCPVPVSSTKPLTGHTLGAAGALELAACFLAARHRILPVHRWDGVRDESLSPLNFVNKSDCPHPLRWCMSNSFAFGGCNVSLILHNERA